MSKLAISIVGAGISGLTLASALFARGIRTTIFDKAGKFTHRPTHAITLHPHAYRALLPLLHLDEATFKRRVTVNPRHIAPAGDFCASRKLLEHLLRKSLSRILINWDSPAASARSGKLHLQSGAVVHKDVIVGADGTHSCLRAALLPTPLTVLPYATYHGRRKLTTEVFEARFADVLRGTNVVEQRVGGAVLQISLSDWHRLGVTTGFVTVGYTYSRPARDGGDALFRPGRAPSAAREIPAELFAEVDALRGKLAGVFAEVFDSAAMRADRMVNWLMRCAPRPLRLKQELGEAARDGVVLIGDAAHAEPVLGSRGANLAIEDALCLADVLAAGGDLRDFYAAREEVWETSGRDSERRLAEWHLQ